MSSALSTSRSLVERMKKSYFCLATVCLGVVVLLSWHAHFFFGSMPRTEMVDSSLDTELDVSPVSHLELLVGNSVVKKAVSQPPEDRQCVENTAGGGTATNMSLAGPGASSSGCIQQPEPVQRTESVTLSEDLDARSRWQMQQINKFCTKYNEDQNTYVLPTRESERHTLFRHLIFSQERKYIFCFIPKTGCTTLRRLLFVMEGQLEEETITWKKVPETMLQSGMRKISYLNLDLPDSERLSQLRTYYKFVMIRNPLERLVSAYRNKIEPPLEYSAHDQVKDPLIRRYHTIKDMDLFQVYRRVILSNYEPQTLIRWAQAKGSYQLSVSFSSYVKWILGTEDAKLNEHFSSILINAAPCRVRYHLYLNFKNYSREVRLLVDKLNSSTDYFIDHNHHGKPEDQTQSTLPHYYSMLSAELKKKLFIRMSKELDFYYHLYPEDRWSHAELLELDQSIYNDVVP